MSYMDALAKMGIGGAHPGGLALTKELLENEKIYENSSILDIGCGTGLTAAYLFEKYQCNVVACDLHSLMIKKATARFQENKMPVKVIMGNAESLPFEDQTFDYILSESVTTFTNINKSLNEYHRVLKPNGKLVAIEMCRASKVSDTELNKFKDFYQVNEVLSIKEWKKRLIECNFSSVTLEKYMISEIGSDVDFNPSKVIGKDVYDTMLVHNELSKQYIHKVFPCIICAEK